MTKQLKFPHIFCNIHPHERVIDACLSEGCRKKLLCLSCRKIHKPSHLKELVPIKIFQPKQMKSHLGSVKSLIGRVDDSYSLSLRKLERLISQLRNSFNERLNKLYNEIKEKMKASEAILHKEALATNLKQLDETFQKALEADQYNRDVLFNTMKTLIDDFIPTKKEREFLEKSANQDGGFFELNEKTSYCIQELKQSLKTLEKSIYCPAKPSSQILPFESDTLKVEKYVNLAAPSDVKQAPYIDKHDSFLIGDKFGYLGLWRSSDFKKVTTQPVHNSKTLCTEYSQKRDLVITSSYDRLIKVLKVGKNNRLRLIKCFKLHFNTIYSIKIMDEKSVVCIAGMDSDISVWNLNSFRQIGIINTNGKREISGMAYHSEEGLLAAGFLNGCVGVFDVVKRYYVANLSTGAPGICIFALNFIQKKSLLVAGINNGMIKFWKMNMRFFESSFNLNIIGLPKTILPVNEGNVLLIATSDSVITLLDIENKKATLIQDLEAGSYGGLGLNPNKKKLIAIDWYQGKFAVMKY